VAAPLATQVGGDDVASLAMYGGGGSASDAVEVVRIGDLGLAMVVFGSYLSLPGLLVLPIAFDSGCRGQRNKDNDHDE